jgi:hypothetical protein
MRWEVGTLVFGLVALLEGIANNLLHHPIIALRQGEVVQVDTLHLISTTPTFDKSRRLTGAKLWITGYQLHNHLERVAAKTNKKS